VALDSGAINSPNGGYGKGGGKRALDWAGPVGLGRPARAHLGPARGLLCLMSVLVSSRCFPLLHVGPCRQFLSELDIAPCLARFCTVLVRSSKFVIFSDQVPDFLELSLLRCMTCTGLKGLVTRCSMNLSRKSCIQR
jgi:hypothetical protein